jgi:hypothetical protein
MLTTHLHLMPRLRMTGVILLLPLHAFMVCTGTTLLLNVKCLINFKISCSFFFLSFFLSPSLFYLLVHSRCRGCLFHLITLRHTPQSVGLLWTRDRPVAETSTWQHKHCTRQTSMPPLGFEPTIPASARPQTYVLDRAATGIGKISSSMLVFRIFSIA